VVQTIAESQFAAALRAAEDPAASPDERAEMLMEIAMGLQMKPRSPQQLHDAVRLYQRALAEQPHELLAVRIRSRMGTALQSLPDGGSPALQQARDCYEQAIPVLRDRGKPTEVAEAELNLGLAIQGLCAVGAARIQDAIQCYHRALRVFGREDHPQEFAVLHNNLAVAYLAIPATDERARMREALAVQSFEEVLKVVNLIDHPSEYAMIQNNLGNALQYAASGHALENNLRALAAYDEALKVRNVRDTPIEYANTISNKANVLRSLPPDADWAAPRDARAEAAALYEEARDVFERYGLEDRARLIAEAISEIGFGARAHNGGNGFSRRGDDVSGLAVSTTRSEDDSGLAVPTTKLS
jgi:tetratricopeptide (TPR) repeat protein